MNKIYSYFLLFLSLAILNIDCGSHMKKFTETRFKMGTIVNISLFEKDAKIAKMQIEKGFSEIDRIAALFYEGVSTSDIYKLNNRIDSTITVAFEVASLLSRAQRISENTTGAFDVTIGTLLELYSFRKGLERIPDSATVFEVKRKIGYQNLKIDLEKNLLTTRNLEFKIVVGALVKGYAVDRAIQIIQSENRNGILINAGGDIRATRRFDQKDWIIGIKDPIQQNKTLDKIAIPEGAVVTSGNYEQFSIINGIRYHHIINPKTGFCSDQSHSCTVIAPSTELADGLATGIFVLGSKEGLKVLDKYPDVECLIVDWDAKIHKSEGFDKYVIND